MEIGSHYEIGIVAIEVRDDGTTGDVYNDFDEFKRDKPSSGYEFGFIVLDTETGLTPDTCNDWNDSVEEAIDDFRENVR